jgi:spore coat polysaccharide biosynthesis protein SpsF
MINATVEVRMTSSRLPGKPLMKAGGMTMLEILIERLSQSKHIQNIIVATTINKQDDPIIDYCIENNICYYRGSENNVLERVCHAAEKYNTDVLVQITGDCPLIDYKLVDGVIDVFLENYPKTRFASNTGPNISMPWGFDAQVYKAEELRKILEDSPTQEDKEHVSHRFYQEKFQSLYNPEFIKYKGSLNRPELRVTLDYMEDYNLIKEIVEDFGIDKLKVYNIEDIIKWLDNHPVIRDVVIKKHNGH